MTGVCNQPQCPAVVLPASRHQTLTLCAPSLAPPVHERARSHRAPLRYIPFSTLNRWRAPDLRSLFLPLRHTAKKY